MVKYLIFLFSFSVSYSLAQTTWYEIRPEFGYIWLDGDHQDKGFYNLVSTDLIDSVTYTALIAKARSHDGAGVKFNKGEQLFFKAGENDLVQLSTLTVPTQDMKQGLNTVRFESFHSEGQKYNNNSHIIKLYFDAENPPAELKSVPQVTFTPLPKALGDQVTFRIEAQDFSGIKSVEYWVYADFFPTVDTKTPTFVQWHKVAASHDYPFSATWDTHLFPDQYDMKVKAVVYSHANVGVATLPSEGHSFQRSFHTQRIWCQDIDRVQFWKEGITDSVWFEATLPDHGTEAHLMLFAWLGAQGYYTEGPVGTVTVNNGKPVDFMMRQTYPDAWTCIVKTNLSDWKNGKNLLTFKTNSPFNKSIMVSTPPGPVLFYCYE